MREHRNLSRTIPSLITTLVRQGTLRACSDRVEETTVSNKVSFEDQPIIG